MFIKGHLEQVPVIAIDGSRILYVRQGRQTPYHDNPPVHDEAIVGRSLTFEEREIIETLLSDALAVELSESA